jgi:hypothetical protein
MPFAYGDQNEFDHIHFAGRGPMPADLIAVATKLSDRGVQDRLRSELRKATLDALKKEGIELSHAEWGELTARAIAARSGQTQADFDWGSIVPPLVPVLASLLSDRRLKTNIVHCETRADGVRMSEFSYLGFTTRWRGVIAQDVRRSHPQAVVEHENGYLTVDYRALNVPLQAA